jgi:hypothetical protein
VGWTLAANRRFDSPAQLAGADPRGPSGRWFGEVLADHFEQRRLINRLDEIPVETGVKTLVWPLFMRECRYRDDRRSLK